MSRNPGGSEASVGQRTLEVVHDRSLRCEFSIPADLAARVRAENARRLALHWERQQQMLPQDAAQVSVPDGLERIAVHVHAHRNVDANADGKPALPAAGATAGASAVAQARHGSGTGTADERDDAGAGSGVGAGAGAGAAGGGRVPAADASVDDDGWADTAELGNAPDAAMLAAVDTLGARRGANPSSSASTAAAPSTATTAIAENSSDSEEDVHWDADDTSPHSFAVKDAAAAAEKVAAAAAHEKAPRDPDEPVLVLDAGAIMDEGADLTEAELLDFQEGMAASLRRDCDAACENLFGRFAEAGACFYSTELESKGQCRRLKKRFPDRQFCVVRFPRAYVDAQDWRQLSTTDSPPASRSLDLLRSTLNNCLRPLSWKIAIFEELQKLADKSEPGRLKREARARARAAMGGGGWDEEEDDDFAFGGGGKGGGFPSAFPSIRDFTAKKEREADVLDMILAMVLQRQPPRQHRETEGDRFTELAELHSEVREKWVREHGDPPSEVQ